MLGCHSEPFACHSEGAKRLKNLTQGKLREESPQKCSSEALASLTSILKGRGYMFGVAGYPRGSRIETLGEPLRYWSG